MGGWKDFLVLPRSVEEKKSHAFPLFKLWSNMYNMYCFDHAAQLLPVVIILQ